MDIGRALRDARHTTGLSQRALAARLGVQPSTVSRYESGAAAPSLAMVDRVLAACGKDLELTLVQRHADLDAELDRLAARPVAERARALELSADNLLRYLADELPSAVVGGAWAAVLQGVPVEHVVGRLHVPDDEPSLTALAALFRRHYARLVVDGQSMGLEVTVGAFRRNPRAEWDLRHHGRTAVWLTAPGEWPVQRRLDSDLGTLHVVPAECLTEDDGVRPAVLERWRRRAAG